MRLDIEIEKRQFRGETKPSKHRLKSSGQIRRTSLQERLSEVASLDVSHAENLSYGMVYGMRFGKEINQFETRRDDHRLYLCHFKEVRLFYSEFLNRCLKVLVSSRNSLLIKFLPLSRLGVILATVRQEISG